MTKPWDADELPEFTSGWEAYDGWVKAMDSWRRIGSSQLRPDSEEAYLMRHALLAMLNFAKYPDSEWQLPADVLLELQLQLTRLHEGVTDSYLIGDDAPQYVTLSPHIRELQQDAVRYLLTQKNNNNLSVAKRVVQDAFGVSESTVRNWLQSPNQTAELNNQPEVVVEALMRQSGRLFRAYRQKPNN
jgi:hypothetical protein